MFDFFDDTLRELRAFMFTYVEALQNASVLLGGQPALRRTQALLHDTMSAPRLTRNMKRDIVVLHDLLTLKNVKNIESLEAANFAEIDPASPIVEELCLLSEALKDAIYRQQDENLINLFEADLAA